MKKISKGIYEYKGYKVSNCGYHHPDHCIWWEAVNLENGCADYHATTKKRNKRINRQRYPLLTLKKNSLYDCSFFMQKKRKKEKLSYF